MIPLLTAAEMRALEREAIDSGRVSSLELQERAARGAADLIPMEVPVEILAGPGNNGGDALAVARLLRDRGQRARVWSLDPDPGWTGDAAVQAELWRKGGGAFAFTEDPADEAALWGEAWVVDGLFGLGSRGPLAGVACGWALGLALAGVRNVLALDLPSGLNPDSPDAQGTVVQARLTACFGYRKLCHGLEPARASCGRIQVMDLGLHLEDSRVRPSHWLVDEPWLPQPAWDVHKRTRGHVAIRAGSVGMSGAAVLAALGALRAGAGLVTVLADAEVRAEIATQIPEAMVQAWEGAIPMGVDVLLAGPGGVSVLPEWQGPMVLDASALRSGEGPQWMARERTIITPHAGEFARLFGLLRKVSTSDRIAQVRAVATGAGVCLLKGPQSLTAGGISDQVWINDTGHWGLATGGTGDFLSGMVAGLFAQGLDARQAAASAAWLHGKCADRLGKGPLLPRDLSDELPRLLRERYA